MTTVMEGSEPDEFWSALGGKAEYPNTKEMPEGERDPQLFQISNETGFVSVTPIYGFAQVRAKPLDKYGPEPHRSLPWHWWDPGHLSPAPSSLP